MTTNFTERSEADYARQRARLLREVQSEIAATRGYTGVATLSDPVATALGTVLRHAFVPDDVRGQAYINAPLPIGHGQTISQPYIVALMTELLALEPSYAVLEIGTGCGYQTAVLAQLVREVYSIEIVEPLGRAAAELLARLGYDNVETRIGDGHRGWPEHAPYDGIIVTAAAPAIPRPLIEQLAPGRRMIVPVGKAYGNQRLVLLEKSPDGGLTEREVLPVAFVPLTGDN